MKSAFFCAMTVEFSWLLDILPKNANIIVAKHWDPENGDSVTIFFFILIIYIFFLKKNLKQFSKKILFSKGYFVYLVQT